MTYPLSLALEDYVPVICAGLGFFWIADTLTLGHTEVRRLGQLGAILVTLGGFCKATWKLVIALSEGTHDVVVLDQALFFLLAAGFVCLSASLLAVRRKWEQPLKPALLVASGVVLLGLLLYFQGFPAYRWMLLAVMVLGNTITLVLAIQEARRRGLVLASFAIGAYLVTGFIMPALARLEQGVGLQWVEQAVNSTGAIGLLAGSALLRRATRRAALP